MACPDYEDKCEVKNDILNILASHGVDFLLSGEEKVPLSSCVGKRICLFFSANWCRPCKTFTPQLIQLYDSLRKRGENLEIIFISFDQTEIGFKDHFDSMPWLALPFNLELQKLLSAKFCIDRIPFFVAQSLEGLPIEEDMIGLIEDYGADAFPFTKKRREELKAMDNAKRDGGNLEEILGHEGRNYVISRDSTKIPISELVGKTIGLYFGAYWSPPSRSFTAKLTETYNEIKNTTMEHSFEIVLVSTDRNIKEFELTIADMPWLAIPYNDKSRQDLNRIFNIKGIPALVLIGPDGKGISGNGKGMVSLYGAKGFPFTESRIRELEAALRKEGEALPSCVKDIKHEHELKLEMAKAYVCDSCAKQGRFWAFSCDVCDYDLHPTCIEHIST